jgi:hypothetical protein
VKKLKNARENWERRGKTGKGGKNWEKCKKYR